MTIQIEVQMSFAKNMAGPNLAQLNHTQAGQRDGIGVSWEVRWRRPHR